MRRFLLPKIVPELRQQFPRLRIYLTEDITQRIYDKLMNGELDLIILALPYALRSVEVLPLFKDEFYLACREDTQHTRPKRYIFDELNPESILLLEDGHCLRDHALSACHLQDVNKISRFTASSILTLVQMVDSDLGISYLPQMVKNSTLLEGTHVKLWELPEKSYREIGFAWRRGSAREAEFRKL
ncbi:MAG: LysR substrate-binding domain-containing protein, partial [Thiotrichaceae bacterium]